MKRVFNLSRSCQATGCARRVFCSDTRSIPPCKLTRLQSHSSWSGFTRQQPLHFTCQTWNCSRGISTLAEVKVRKKKRPRNRTLTRKRRRRLKGNEVKRSKRHIWDWLRTQEEEKAAKEREKERLKNRVILRPKRKSFPRKVLGDQRATAARADDVYCELHRLRTTGREMSELTFNAIQRWFQSDNAARASERRPPSEEDVAAALESNGVWHGLGWIGKGRWSVETSKVNEDGVCVKCKQKLATYQINSEDEKAFAKRVAELAFRSAHSYKFKIFHDWVNLSELYDVILDGSNLRKHSVDSQHRMIKRASFHEILNAAVNELRMQSLRFLVVLDKESAHANGSSPVDNAKDFLYELKQRNELFVIGPNMDTGWFCLYAAAKHSSLFITNDNFEKPLNIFHKKFLPKWIERHQARFRLPVQYIWPPPYSATIQESANGSWHIPSAVGKDAMEPRVWLCATRPQDLQIGV